MAATVATYAEQLPMANDVHFSSELPPSGKPKEEFRNYQNSQRHKLVSNHYRNMRCNQTLAFVEKMEAKYNSFQHAEMTVWEAFEKLGSYVDSSDPDTDNPNLEHMLQTAEGIRAAGHPDWLQLVGLLHDLGKMMFLWGTAEDGQQATADGPQWALGGDTWVVGCAIPDTIVFSEYNELNPDMHDDRYNTPMGIYSPHCGLKNLKFAWGHDEYMYRMLVHNKASIPEEGLACIRYHSCYVLHRSGEYKELLSEEDEYLLKWVREFNKFDLYTKSDARPNVDELRPYYQSLIDKYMPGKLHW